jgi:hypothetical protein
MIMYLSSALAVEILVVMVFDLSRRKRKKLTATLLGVSILIPTAAAIASVVMDDYLSGRTVYLTRSSFTCEPRLASVTSEWLIIHIHFCVGAAISTVSTFISCVHVWKLAEMRSRMARTSLNAGLDSFSLQQRGSLTVLAESKFRSVSTGIEKMRQNHTLKLTVMTVNAAFLFLVYTITHIYSSIQLKDYANNLDNFFVDSLEHTDCGNNCTEKSESRPSVLLTALSYLSLSCVPLLNGIVFVNVRGFVTHVKALACGGRGWRANASVLPDPNTSGH